MDDSDIKEKPKVLEEPKDRNIFINQMNSFISNFLIDSLREDKHNFFTGTLADPNIVNSNRSIINDSKMNKYKLPKNFEPKIVKIDPKSTYEHNIDLFNNNYFIYDLENSNYSEIEYIIKGLRTKEFEEDKTLILVSNILTWARTPPKIIKEGEENNDNNELDELNPEDPDYEEKKAELEAEMENKENMGEKPRRRGRRR